jgi:hypothetical protein
MQVLRQTIQGWNLKNIISKNFNVFNNFYVITGAFLGSSPGYFVNFSEGLLFDRQFFESCIYQIDVLDEKADPA